MAADWSELPCELLQLISRKLNSELYLIRSRSVCSWWRSSIPNYYQKHYLPVKFGQLSCQLFGSHTNVDSVSYLINNDIFLIKPPKHQQTLHRRPWIIRIGPYFDGKTKLLHPLLFNEPLPSRFNNVLDFNKLFVNHLQQMSFIYHFNLLSQIVLKLCVTTCRGEQPLEFLTTDLYGNPIMLRCVDNRSKTIPNMLNSFHGGNVCVFKGWPCVVDKTGRTFVIGSDLSYHLLAEPVFGGESKFLIESSEFELLLVDCYKNGEVIVWIELLPSCICNKERRKGRT